MSQDTEREDFEAWCLDYHEIRPRWNGVRYDHDVWQDLWLAFCAGRAALATQQAGQGEPVGEVQWAAGVIGSIREVKWAELCPPVGTKLFASPPPREPMTDEQQLKTFQRFRHQWKHQQEPGNGDFFVAGIETAEAHHGIHSREGGSKS